MATAGVAIGLGNVWRFPYMMGLYGGATFLLVYLVIVLAFGIPALMAEWALGRSTRSGPLGSFVAVGMPGGRFWGLLLLLTVTMAASYYGLVLAWVLASLGLFASGHGTVEGGQLLEDLLAHPGLQILCLAATVAAACGALHLGVRRGIERLSRAVLPVFFALFLVLIGRVLTLPGAGAGVRVYLLPRWDQLNGTTFLAALGQAFFSLALGGTFMLIYGSYLRREDRIPGDAVATALTDLAAALLAGLAVVPAVVAFGLDLRSGPALMFQVLPQVFARLPAGDFFGTLFFLSVFLVALLSLMAAYEVLVSALVDHLGWRRGRALVVVGAAEVVLGLPAVWSLGYLETSDLLWGSTLQPLGGAVAVVALAWFGGRAKTLEEIGRGTRLPAARFLYFWLRFVIPLGILATLIYGWWEKLNSA